MVIPHAFPRREIAHAKEAFLKSVKIGPISGQAPLSPEARTQRACASRRRSSTGFFLDEGSRAQSRTVFRTRAISVEREVSDGKV